MSIHLVVGLTNHHVCGHVDGASHGVVWLHEEPGALTGFIDDQLQTGNALKGFSRSSWQLMEMTSPSES